MNFIKHYLKICLLIIPLSVFIGIWVAFFLWSLDSVTLVRFRFPVLIFFLPLAGILIHFLYAGLGKSSEKGNNLVIEEIHSPNLGLPWQMGPLILISTLITHLFGGSAGREGTAVQMGAGFASTYARWIKIDKSDWAILLISGMAGGFGAVFGTPITGALFAIEVLVIGRIQWKGFIPAILSSYIAHWVVLYLGIRHKSYSLNPIQSGFQSSFPYFPMGFSEILKILALAILLGLASRFFSILTHFIKGIFLKYFKVLWLIPVLGGIILIGLTWLLGTRDYLGLGVLAEFPRAYTLPSSFYQNGTGTWSWLFKTLYTSITLGTGFKGGEVTPLFYIGASLGNSIAVLLHSPVNLFAGLGFIGVFSGATKTPWACTLMGIELFGGHFALYFLIVCWVSFWASGKSGIYTTQKNIRNFH